MNWAIGPRPFVLALAVLPLATSAQLRIPDEQPSLPPGHTRPQFAEPAPPPDRMAEAQRIAAIKAKASKELLAFAAFAKAVVRGRTLANSARLCNLRSYAWHQTVINGFLMVYHQKRDAHQLSADEEAFIQAEQQAAMAKAAQDYPVGSPEVGCRRLMKSQELASLDDVQRGLTGDYH